MTILEIMERAGTKDVKLVRAWIKDGIHLIQSTGVDSLKIKKQNIVNAADGDDHQYDLPSDMISLDSISILDTNDDNKYKRISRLVGEIEVSEDTTP